MLILSVIPRRFVCRKPKHKGIFQLLCEILPNSSNICVFSPLHYTLLTLLLYIHTTVGSHLEPKQKSVYRKGNLENIGDTIRWAASMFTVPGIPSDYYILYDFIYWMCKKKKKTIGGMVLWRKLCQMDVAPLLPRSFSPSKPRPLSLPMGGAAHDKYS